MNRLMLVILVFVMACTPTPVPANTPQLIKIHATPATQAWLSNAYNCADKLGIILSNVDDPNQAEINIRMGEPAKLSSPSFLIGQEDLLVVTHRESKVQNLTIEEVRSLFSNPEALGMEIWVFASGQDIQEVFSRDVLGGHVVTSLARVAVSPQQMSDTLNQDKNAVGILPRHWKAGTVRDVFTYPNIPVLALVKSEPQGLVKALLACLQK